MPVLSEGRAGGYGSRARGVTTGAAAVTGTATARRAVVPAFDTAPTPRRGRVPGRQRPGGGARGLPGATRPVVTACTVSRRPADGWRWPLAVAVAVFAVIVGFGSTVGGLAEGMAPAVPKSTTVVAVAPGESLWQLAERYAPGADAAAVVTRIETLNDITAGQVSAGDVLSVPTAGK
ncbi:MAG: hypothetical protein GEV00_02835 [Actinophytocola sp.]|nr:hypothetical protein [Actinophytocola sp.]